MTPLDGSPSPRPDTIQRERQAALDILRANIRDDYAEARPDRRILPRRAVDNATPEALRAFLAIQEGLSQLVDPSHIRSRYIGVATSTGGYGLAYYRNPIISRAANRTNTEIQTVCLPTKPEWQGILEVYFSGHDEVPVQCAETQVVGTRAGQPVFHVRNAPTRRFVRQTIDAFRRSSILSPH